MTSAKFSNGSPQDLYFPVDHPSNPGAFKGMMNILMEHGYMDSSSLCAQCDGFKCTAGATSCCCRRIMVPKEPFLILQERIRGCL